jgi:mono/diheme cytochrome c family protein
MVSQEMSPEYQQEIADVLSSLFGSPDKPMALPETGLDQNRLDRAAGPAWSDQEGKTGGLYREHCAYCHGITGDGRGPTARFLYPYPRDYLPGIYKFKSTYGASQPSDEDLHTVLVNGIPGTSMPSYDLLPSSELEALVEYEKYLSMRGQMETELINYVYDELGEEDGERIPLDPTSDPQQHEVIREILAEISSEWEEASERVIQTEEDWSPGTNRAAREIAVSVDQGRELFYGARANCVTCHGLMALGDGLVDDQDVWNKTNKKFHEDTARLSTRLERARSRSASNGADREWLEADRIALARREAVAARLYPVRNTIPRNLRRGYYRGGGRPLDISRRIHAGIPGTPMPGSGPAIPGAQGTLTDAEIGNLVDYVLSLPYETASPSQRSRSLYLQPIPGNGEEQEPLMNANER